MQQLTIVSTVRPDLSRALLVIDQMFVNVFSYSFMQLPMTSVTCGLYQNTSQMPGNLFTATPAYVQHGQVGFDRQAADRMSHQNPFVYRQPSLLRQLRPDWICNACACCGRLLAPGRKSSQWRHCAA